MNTLFTAAQTGRLKQLLEAGGKKLVLYHRDADGISAVALLKRFFPDIELIPREGPKLENAFLKELARQKPAVLAFLDLPVDEEWKKLKKLQEGLPGCALAVIDHHLVQHDLNREGVLYINPQLHQKAYLPTSYIIFYLLEKLVGSAQKGELETVVWQAGMGVIGDHAYTGCADLLQKCRRLGPGLVHHTPEKGGLYEGATLLTAAVAAKGTAGAAYAVRLLLKAGRFAEFVKDSRLKEWKQAFDEAFGKLVQEFGTQAERYPRKKLVFYEIATKLNLTSVIASHFSERYPDEVVVISKKSEDGGYKVSARCQAGRVNVGEMMKTCSEGIGMGGGHTKAAGGFVHDWEEFERRVLEFVK